MGTPAFIGLQVTEDGPITGVYCHDGYFEALAVLLYENYRTLEQVEELVNLGNLSSLGETLTSKRTQAYIRDWKRPAYKNVKAVFRDLKHIEKDANGGYNAYFVFSINKWYTSDRGRYLISLSNALLQMDLLVPVATVCNCRSCSR